MSTLLVGDKDIVDAERLHHPYDIAVHLTHEDAGEAADLLLTELGAEHLHYALGVALHEATR